MSSVGVRELRQRASELLRRVAAGETIEITDRGRPVALLSPTPACGPYDAMLASGGIEAAATAFDDLPEPVELGSNAELLGPCLRLGIGPVGFAGVAHLFLLGLPALLEEAARVVT